MSKQQQKNIMIHNEECEATAPSSFNGAKKERRNVTFGNIVFFHFANAIGENPSVSSGTPIALSTEPHQRTSTIDIDFYENIRKPRRRGIQLYISPDDRRRTLQVQGFNKAEIDAAYKNTRRRPRRDNTVHMQGQVIDGVLHQDVRANSTRISMNESSRRMDNRPQTPSSLTSNRNLVVSHDDLSASATPDESLITIPSFGSKMYLVSSQCNQDEAPPRTVQRRASFVARTA